VEVRGLSKRLGARQVLDGLSFTVERGEVFALVGSNGAGKTTTIETLEGYHVPDTGEVRVLGEEPRRAGRRLRARIGVMLQEGGLYPALSAREILRLFARYYAAPLDPDALLDTVGLAGAGKTPYRRLSGGEKQRLSLAAALIGRPDLLFLDEPTTGMDPGARQITWSLIREHQARGVTVLLTSHQMDEVERYADRVAVIDGGRLLALDTPLALRNADVAGIRTIRVRTRVPTAAAALAGLPSILSACADGPSTLFAETAAPAHALVELTGWARDADVELVELTVGDASLEDAVLRLTAAVAEKGRS